MKKITVTLLLFFSVTLCKAQWVQTKGPTGGPILCLKQLGDTVYAGTYGGVFYSINMGISWNALNNGLGNFRRVDFICYGNGNLYIHADSGGLSGKVFKMSEGGNTWSQIYSMNWDARAMAVSDNYICLGANNNYLLQSYDGGANWTYGATSPVSNCYCLYSVGDSVYLEGGGGMYLRILPGTLWSHIPNSCGGADFLYKFQGEIYLTDDHGIHSLSINCNYVFSYMPTSYYFNSITSNDTSLYFGTGNNGVYVYSDTAGTWVASNSGFSNLYIPALIWHNGILIAGTGDGIFRSDDNGAHWIKSDSGLIATLPEFAIHDSVIVSRNNGLNNKSYTRSFNSGNSWEMICDTGWYATPMYVVATNGKDFFMDGELYSKDNGSSWNYNSVYGSFPTMSHCMLCDSGIVYTGSTGGPGNFLSYSTDTAATWQHNFQPPEPGYIYALGKQGGYIHIWLSNSFSHTFKTNNNGSTWQQTNFPGSNYCESIVGIGNYVYYGYATGSRIFRSGDGGTTVIEIDSNRLAGQLYNLYVLNDKYLFAGTTAGVYFSADSGRSCFQLNDGLINKQIFRITSNNEFLFLSTQGNGIWKRSIADFTSNINHLIVGANFSASDSDFCGYGCVNFFDQSSNADSCYWYFPGGNPSNSTLHNPSAICYSSLGSYDVTLIATHGAIHDTLEFVNYITISPQTTASVSQAANTLYALSVGDIQWYDCAAQQIIPGENGVSFTPVATGYYAAIISNGWCVDTSDCISVIVNSISEISSTKFFSINPNPAITFLTLEYTVTATLTIYNLLGEQVQEISLERNTTKKNISLTNIPSGIYFCVLRTEDGKIAQQKLVVAK